VHALVGHLLFLTAAAGKWRVAYAATPVETVVHLIRHGKVHNPENVRYGRAPGFHLSELGRAQAKAAGARLKELGQPLAAFVSSPLERAVETAEIIAAELGIGPPATDPRLLESVNRFDGMHRYAVLLPWTWPRLWNPFKPSWGEPFAEIAARMSSIIFEQRDAHPGGVVVLVSHQAPIWIARQSFERPGVPWLAKVRCTQASITTLRFDGAMYRGHEYWAPPM
jgi:broad specificity phosphatase PhoE